MSRLHGLLVICIGNLNRLLHNLLCFDSELIEVHNFIVLKFKIISIKRIANLFLRTEWLNHSLKYANLS